MSAHLDEAGRLHIDGQDLGAGTELVSGDGELEARLRGSDIPADRSVWSG